MTTIGQLVQEAEPEIRRYQSDSAVASNLAVQEEKFGGPGFEKVSDLEGVSSSGESYDFVSAGAGPAGLLTALYLNQKYGHRVAVFDKEEVGTSTKAWNISWTQLLRLEKLGLFTRGELESVLDGKFEHGIVRLYDRIKDETRIYDLDGCLQLAVSPKKLLTAVREKLEKNGGVVIDQHSFENYKIGEDGRKYVVLTGEYGQRVIETKLLYSAMGCRNDPMYTIANEGEVIDYYNVIGVDCELSRPYLDDQGRILGEILATLYDVMPGEDFQRFLEWFPSGHSDVFYLFSLTREPRDLLELGFLLEDEIEAYVGAYLPGAEIRPKKIVYKPIPLPQDSKAKVLSPVDGVYFGGENAGVSPLVGSGLEAVLQNLKCVGEQLHRALRSGRLSQRRLNAIRLDPGCYSSWGIQGLFTPAMKLQAGEEPWAVSRHCILIYEGTRNLDMRTKAEMMESKIRTKHINNVVAAVLSSPVNAEVLKCLYSNNRGRGWDMTRMLVRSYASLAWRDFKHIVRHAVRLEGKKLRKHSEEVLQAAWYAPQLARRVRRMNRIVRGVA